MLIDTPRSVPMLYKFIQRDRLTINLKVADCAQVVKWSIPDYPLITDLSLAPSKEQRAILLFLFSQLQSTSPVLASYFTMLERAWDSTLLLGSITSTECRRDSTTCLYSIKTEARSPTFKNMCDALLDE